MDEPLISQKAFIIIFLVLMVVAVGVGFVLKGGESGVSVSPSPSAELNFGASPPSQGQQLSNPQNQPIQKQFKQYPQFPGVLPVEQITGKKAIIETTKGTIEFEIFAEEAPKAASNFVFLANDKFYDGLVFHRVEPGFVIQGGDPLGNGTGGPGYKFEDEPVKRKYDKGIVAMANAGPNTNGSQFFIMLENNPLPPNYTIFGKVTKGQDVVSKIQKGDTMTRVRIENL